ncbi:MAG: hypothetical protein GF350_08155 [Chitinivibrionales bacterium]|nr:hypothetical protein [Chitinivibrionales bacterium]
MDIMQRPENKAGSAGQHAPAHSVHYVDASAKDGYSSLLPQFERHAQEIAEYLNSLKAVYALKYEVCRPDEYVEKIQQIQNSGPDTPVTGSNFLACCPEVISVGVLYVNGPDLLDINRHIVDTWDLAEGPSVVLNGENGGDMQRLVQREKYPVRTGDCRSVEYRIQCGSSRKRAIARVSVRQAFEDAWYRMEQAVKDRYGEMRSVCDEQVKMLRETGEQFAMVRQFLQNSGSAGTTPPDSRNEKVTAVPRQQSIVVDEDGTVLINSPEARTGSRKHTRGVPVEDLTRTDFIREQELVDHTKTGRAGTKDEVVFNAQENDPTNTRIIRSISETVEMKRPSGIQNDSEATAYVSLEDLQAKETSGGNRENTQSAKEKPNVVRASDDIVINLSGSEPEKDKESYQRPHHNQDIASTVFVSKDSLKKGK